MQMSEEKGSVVHVWHMYVYTGMCTYVYREGVVCTLNRAENRAQKQQHREAGAQHTRVGGNRSWSL